MIFVTGNLTKLKEFDDILGFKIDHREIDLIEIQSVEVEEVVRNKVIEAYNKLKEPVIVEDTGLYFEELNGLPGALIKFFLKKLSLEQIHSLLKENKKAEAVTCLAYYDGQEISIFKGIIKGEIVHPRGDNGFGWDSIFVPEGSNKTFAELSSVEKNHNSMRREAISKFKLFIDKRE